MKRMTLSDQTAFDSSIARLAWECEQLRWSIRDRALYEAEIARLTEQKKALEARVAEEEKESA